MQFYETINRQCKKLCTDDFFMDDSLYLPNERFFMLPPPEGAGLEGLGEVFLTLGDVLRF